MSKKALVPLVALATALLLLSCAQNINLPSPSVKSINPTSGMQGAPGFTLTVNGGGFSPQSAVLWNGAARATLFQSGSVLTAMINPSDLATPGTIPVSVFTPAPGGGTSNSVNFTINPSTSPVPQITSLSPSGAFAGTSQINLLVTGTGFVPQSVVTWNGNNRTTFVQSSTQLTAAITTADLASAMTAQVGVLNPPPGGGSSNALPFAVTNAQPIFSAMSPATTAAGGTSSVTVSVTGSGFSTASIVNLNGSPRTTIFVAGSQLNFTVTQADQAAAQTFEVTIFNPPPGGGTSGILGFSVIAPAKGTGLPELVDIASDGEQANQGIGNVNNSGPTMGGNGRFVAFASISTNLVATDTDAVPLQDIYARDTCLGQASGCTPTTLAVNFASDNITEANAPSFEPSMSGDGRFVAFTSAATNLVAGVTSGAREVYLRDTCLGNLNCTASLKLISVATDGTSAADGDSFQASVSPDGRYVAFASVATDLVTGLSSGAQEIYLRDTCNGVSSGCTPKTFLVSTPDGTTPADGASSRPVAANNGLFVAFSSTATNLATGTTGIQEIFLRGTCVNVASGCTPVTKLVSAADAAGTTPANDVSQQPSISNDGRLIAFATKATNLASGTGGFRQIYLRDACTGASGCTAATTLVSTPDGTTAGNGDSSSPQVSNNGQFVAFDSFASNLVASDTNNFQDVFVRNTCATASGCTTKTVLASVASGGAQGNGNSLRPAIRGDGHFVTFISFANNLVSVDTNNHEDIFLAVTTF